MDHMASVNCQIARREYPLDDQDLPLHTAAFEGNISLLSSLVENSPDINVGSIHNCTALHLAIRGNQGAAVSLLFSHGADPDLVDDVEPAYMVYDDAVKLAARFGSQNAMKALIEHGILIRSDVLLVAASLGRVDCMRTLLEELVEFADLPKEAAVAGALRRAAMCWHLGAVEFLLREVSHWTERGKDLGEALIGAVDNFCCDDRCRGRGAFGYWNIEDMERGLDVVKALVAAGADANIESNGNHRQLTTPLECGLRNGSFACGFVPCLLRNGACPASVSADLCPTFGATQHAGDVKVYVNFGASPAIVDQALHYANKRSVAEELIKYGANIHKRDENGYTPLHWACQGSFLEVTELLISQGVEVDVAALDGSTPLFLAASESNKWADESPSRLQLCQLLISSGANVNAPVANGLTPLHRAASDGNIHLVLYLISQGANVYGTTNDGETILHSACSVSKKRTLQIVQLLLDLKADLEARDANGATPIFVAIDRANRRGFDEDLVGELIQRGANLDVRDHEGLSAREFAKGVGLQFNADGTLRKASEENLNLVYPRPYLPVRKSFRGLSTSRGRGRGRGVGRGRGRGG